MNKGRYMLEYTTSTLYQLVNGEQIEKDRDREREKERENKRTAMALTKNTYKNY